MIPSSSLLALATCLLGLTLAACVASGEKEAKETIERTLVDPASVQYREVKNFDDGTVCGQFNAKNRMGGYIGFESFVYFRSKLRASKQYLPILCSNEKNKEDLIRSVDPEFRTTKDREACMAEAKAGKSGAALSVTDVRKEETRLRDACAPATDGF